MADPVDVPAPVTTGDGRAYVRLNSGAIASVPPEQLSAFVAEGRGSLATPEEVAANEERKQYSGAGSAAAAFGEGALSGATVGLYDAAAKAIAPEYAEGLAKRREYNETAAGIGEGVGIVGSTLLTGGESLLAKGAAAASAPARGLIAGGELAQAGARALLKKEGAGVISGAIREGLAQAAGGTIEGALFSGAKQVTDDYLNDHEITKDRVLTAMGTGALWGGGLSGALGFTGNLAGQGFKKAADIFNRSEADNDAAKALDSALRGEADSSARLGADAGAGAVAEVEGATLTADQRAMAEMGLRTDDQVVIDLHVPNPEAERQGLLAKLQGEGEEAVAAREFGKSQQELTRSLVERGNQVAKLQDELQPALNRSRKEQAARNALEVYTPELQPVQLEGMLAHVDDVARNAQKQLDAVKSGQRELTAAEHNALADVVESAQTVRNKLKGSKPDLMEAKPREAVTYNVNKGEVRRDLTIANAQAPEGVQYVLRYVPLDEIEASARPLGAGPLGKISESTKAPPISARFAEEAGKYVLEDGARRVAAAREAGLTHVPAIVPEASTVGLMNGARDRDGVARLFMAFDDFKGAIGRAARKASHGTPQVNTTEALLQRDYMTVRAMLEDESLLGKPLATMQRLTNAAESEAIRTGRAFERRFVQDDALQKVRSGEHGFDTLSTLDSGKTGGFLNNLGKAENAEAEADFLLGLQRNIDVMKAKGQFYSVTPEQAAKIAQAEELVKSMVADVRSLKRTKELANLHADKMAAASQIPVYGETLAKAKITLGKTINLAQTLGMEGRATATGGRATAAAGSSASTQGSASVRAAMKGERKVLDAAKGVVQWLRDTGAATVKGAQKAAKKAAKAAEAAPLLGVSLSTDPASYEHAIRNISALRDPESPERARVRANLYPLRTENPALADALETHTQRVAEFLASKAGELSAAAKPGDPFGNLRKPRHDPSKAAKLAKYIDAAINPAHALDRAADGEIRREDVEVLQTLYPRLYQRMVTTILTDLGEVGNLPSYDARVKLGNLINAPTDPSMQPARQAQLQALAKSGAQPKAQAQDGAPPATPPSKQRPPQIASLYETRADVRARHLAN